MGRRQKERGRRGAAAEEGGSGEGASGGIREKLERWLPVGLVTGLLLLAAALWHVHEETARKDGFSVLLTGDTAGCFLPLGSPGTRLGGLPRRAGLAAKLRESGPLLALDAGGAVSGNLPYDRIEMEHIFRAEALLGIAAHNLGAPEVALEAGTLRTLDHDIGIPFVSANAQATEMPPFSQRRILLRIAGCDVGITGITTAPAGGPVRGVEVRDARSALRELLPGLRHECEVLVVLAYVDLPQLLALAAEFPQVDLFLGGPTGHPYPPALHGRTVVAAATDQGRRAVVLRVKPPAEPGGPVRWTGALRDLVEGLPEPEPVLQLVDGYRKVLAAKDMEPGETPFMPRLRAIPGLFVAGSDRCIPCHSEAAAAWLASRHSEAGGALARDGLVNDPQCLRCHSTCYGYPGGFARPSASSTLRAVGCESCHGPSASHAEQPTRHTPWDARTTCISCHDADNSPRFELESYQARIEHRRR
ncbi:MAG: hypothetical protein HY303_01915 [Candidatus Wallbacteria bacterium]|nr:hypothetical protein [Candidatus Wallbacteria bacterium]